MNSDHVKLLWHKYLASNSHEKSDYLTQFLVMLHHVCKENPDAISDLGLTSHLQSACNILVREFLSDMTCHTNDMAPASSCTRSTHKNDASANDDGDNSNILLRYMQRSRGWLLVSVLLLFHEAMRLERSSASNTTKNKRGGRKHSKSHVSHIMKKSFSSSTLSSNPVSHFTQPPATISREWYDFASMVASLLQLYHKSILDLQPSGKLEASLASSYFPSRQIPDLLHCFPQLLKSGNEAGFHRFIGRFETEYRELCSSSPSSRILTPSSRKSFSLPKRQLLSPTQKNEFSSDEEEEERAHESRPRRRNAAGRYASPKTIQPASVPLTGSVPTVTFDVSILSEDEDLHQLLTDSGRGHLKQPPSSWLQFTRLESLGLDPETGLSANDVRLLLLSMLQELAFRFPALLRDLLSVVLEMLRAYRHSIGVSLEDLLQHDSEIEMIQRLLSFLAQLSHDIVVNNPRTTAISLLQGCRVFTHVMDLATALSKCTSTSSAVLLRCGVCEVLLHVVTLDFLLQHCALSAHHTLHSPVTDASKLFATWLHCGGATLLTSLLASSTSHVPQQRLVLALARCTFYMRLAQLGLSHEEACLRRRHRQCLLHHMNRIMQHHSEHVARVPGAHLLHPEVSMDRRSNGVCVWSVVADIVLQILQVPGVEDLPASPVSNGHSGSLQPAALYQVIRLLFAHPLCCCVASEKVAHACLHRFLTFNKDVATRLNLFRVFNDILLQRDNLWFGPTSTVAVTRGLSATSQRCSSCEALKETFRGGARALTPAWKRVFLTLQECFRATQGHRRALAVVWRQFFFLVKQVSRNMRQALLHHVVVPLLQEQLQTFSSSTANPPVAILGTTKYLIIILPHVLSRFTTEERKLYFDLFATIANVRSLRDTLYRTLEVILFGQATPETALTEAEEEQLIQFLLNQVDMRQLLGGVGDQDHFPALMVEHAAIWVTYECLFLNHTAFCLHFVKHGHSETAYLLLKETILRFDNLQSYVHDAAFLHRFLQVFQSLLVVVIEGSRVRRDVFYSEYSCEVIYEQIEKLLLQHMPKEVDLAQEVLWALVQACAKLPHQWTHAKTVECFEALLREMSILKQEHRRRVACESVGSRDDIPPGDVSTSSSSEESDFNESCDLIAHEEDEQTYWADFEETVVSAPGSENSADDLDDDDGSMRSVASTRETYASFVQRRQQSLGKSLSRDASDESGVENFSAALLSPGPDLNVVLTQLCSRVTLSLDYRKFHHAQEKVLDALVPLLHNFAEDATPRFSARGAYATHTKLLPRTFDKVLHIFATNDSKFLNLQRKVIHLIRATILNRVRPTRLWSLLQIVDRFPPCVNSILEMLCDVVNHMPRLASHCQWNFPFVVTSPERVAIGSSSEDSGCSDSHSSRNASPSDGLLIVDLPPVTSSTGAGVLPLMVFTAVVDATDTPVGDSPGSGAFTAWLYLQGPNSGEDPKLRRGVPRSHKSRSPHGRTTDPSRVERRLSYPPRGHTALCSDAVVREHFMHLLTISVRAMYQPPPVPRRGFSAKPAIEPPAESAEGELKVFLEPCTGSVLLRFYQLDESGIDVVSFKDISSLTKKISQRSFGSKEPTESKTDPAEVRPLVPVSEKLVKNFISLRKWSHLSVSWHTVSMKQECYLSSQEGEVNKYFLKMELQCDGLYRHNVMLACFPGTHSVVHTSGGSVLGQMTSESSLRIGHCVLGFTGHRNMLMRLGNVHVFGNELPSVETALLLYLLGPDVVDLRSVHRTWNLRQLVGILRQQHPYESDEKISSVTESLFQHEMECTKVVRNFLSAHLWAVVTPQNPHHFLYYPPSIANSPASVSVTVDSLTSSGFTERRDTIQGPLHWSTEGGDSPGIRSRLLALNAVSANAGNKERGTVAVSGKLSVRLMPESIHRSTSFGNLTQSSGVSSTKGGSGEVVPGMLVRRSISQLGTLSPRSSQPVLTPLKYNSAYITWPPLESGTKSSEAGFASNGIISRRVALDTSLETMGGVSALLVLFGKVVGLCRQREESPPNPVQTPPELQEDKTCSMSSLENRNLEPHVDEQTPVLVLKLLCLFLRRNPTAQQQFQQMQGYKMLAKVFISGGPWKERDGMEVSSSSSCLLWNLVKLLVNQLATGILIPIDERPSAFSPELPVANGKVVRDDNFCLEGELLCDFLINWRVWDTLAAASSEETLCVLLNALLSLVGERNRWQMHNAAYFQRLGLVEKILFQCQDRVQTMGSLPSEAICRKLVACLETCIGSPPEMGQLNALCDCLLLFHPPSRTYIVYKVDKYFMLPQYHMLPEGKDKYGTKRISSTSRQTSRFQTRDSTSAAVDSPKSPLKESEEPSQFPVLTTQKSIDEEDKVGSPTTTGLEEAEVLRKFYESINTEEDVAEGEEVEEDTSESDDEERSQLDVTVTNGDFWEESLVQTAEEVKVSPDLEMRNEKEILGPSVPVPDKGGAGPNHFSRDPSGLTLVEGLLSLMCDIIRAKLPDCMVNEVLTRVLRVEVLLALALHPVVPVRERALELFFLYMNLARGFPQIHMPRLENPCVFLLMANQLHQNAASPRLMELAFAVLVGQEHCISLQLDVSSPSAEVLENTFMGGCSGEGVPYERTCCVLLALLPQCGHDLALCSAVLRTFLAVLKNSPDILMACIQAGLMESLSKVVYAVCKHQVATSEGSRQLTEDSTPSASFNDTIRLISGKTAVSSHQNAQFVNWLSHLERFIWWLVQDLFLSQDSSYIFALHESLKTWQTFYMKLSNNYTVESLSRNVASHILCHAYAAILCQISELSQRPLTDLLPNECLLYSRDSTAAMPDQDGLHRQTDILEVMDGDAQLQWSRSRRIAPQPTSPPGLPNAYFYSHLAKSDRNVPSSSTSLSRLQVQTVKTIISSAVDHLICPSNGLSALLPNKDMFRRFHLTVVEFLIRAMAASLKRNKSCEWFSLVWSAKDTLRVLFARLLVHTTGSCYKEIMADAANMRSIPSQETIESSIHAQLAAFEMGVYVCRLLCRETQCAQILKLAFNDMGLPTRQTVQNLLTLRIHLLNPISSGTSSSSRNLDRDRWNADMAAVDKVMTVLRSLSCMRDVGETQLEADAALWYTENQRTSAAWMEKLKEWHRERTKNKQKKYQPLEDRAIYLTQVVSNMQSNYVKQFHLNRKEKLSQEVDVKQQWRRLVADLRREMAVWFEKDFCCTSWILDSVEGPSRMRKRLCRGSANLPQRFFLPERSSLSYADTMTSNSCDRDPLAYLTGEDTWQGSDEASATLHQLHISDSFRLSMKCTQVELQDSFVVGELLIGQKQVYFVADAQQPVERKGRTRFLHPKDKLYLLKWPFHEIREYHPRRFQLRDTAVEIFLTSGQTYFLTTETERERDQLLHVLDSLPLPRALMGGGNSLRQMQLAWQSGRLPNFDYLMFLNTAAGRSYNDLMQYPVFPFVIKEYESSILDMSLEQNYRVFERPISVQTEERQTTVSQRFHDLQQTFSELVPHPSPTLPHQQQDPTSTSWWMALVSGGGNAREKRKQRSQTHSSEDASDDETDMILPPYHYSSHYSNSVTVAYYLIRLPPFTETFVHFQDGHFDVADRTFYSISTAWKLSTTSNSCVKELLPEFFYLPEFLQNRERFDFGHRQNGEAVDHVELPKWCRNDERLFVLIHRAMLESCHVTSKLPLWIDLIFGFKQVGKAAVKALNLFHPYTYYKAINPGEIRDPIRRRAVVDMIRNYGQTPKQLFTRGPHGGSLFAYSKFSTSSSPLYLPSSATIPRRATVLSTSASPPTRYPIGGANAAMPISASNVSLHRSGSTSSLKYIPSSPQANSANCSPATTAGNVSMSPQMEKRAMIDSIRGLPWGRFVCSPDTASVSVVWSRQYQQLHQLLPLPQASISSPLLTGANAWHEDATFLGLPSADMLPFADAQIHRKSDTLPSVNSNPAALCMLGCDGFPEQRPCWSGFQPTLSCMALLRTRYRDVFLCCKFVMPLPGTTAILVSTRELAMKSGKVSRVDTDLTLNSSQQPVIGAANSNSFIWQRIYCLAHVEQVRRYVITSCAVATHAPKLFMGLESGVILAIPLGVRGTDPPPSTEPTASPSPSPGTSPFPNTSSPLLDIPDVHSSKGPVYVMSRPAVSNHLNMSREPEEMNTLCTEMCSQLHGHLCRVTCLHVCDSFTALISGDDTGCVLIWDIHQLALLRVLSSHGDGPSACFPTPSTPVARPTGMCQTHDMPHHVRVKRLTMSPTLGDVAILWESFEANSKSQHFLSVMTLNGRLIRQIQCGPGEVIESMAYSTFVEGRNVNVLLLGMNEGRVKIRNSWTLETVTCLQIGESKSHSIVDARYTENGRRLYVLDSSGWLFLLECPLWSSPIKALDMNRHFLPCLK